MPALPMRGPAVREAGVALPPDRMRLMRGGRPLKRWRYTAVYGPELMLCVGDARIGGLPQRWWALALPDGRLFEGSRLDGSLVFDEGPGVEVLSPHGRSYIWTRKQAGVQVTGSVRAGGLSFEISGPLGFVDESAGYHARHTSWRWSAGIGRLRDGRAVAWNLVDGVHDAPTSSERTVWVEGEPREVPAVEFAPDLSAVGDLSFTEWCAREDHTNLLVMRSDYRQPFGSFAGSLPGGLELDSGYGVMEWHDVRW
jgi:Domain of unknown function (DUF2804), C-terminal